ncbi:hypothetical protein GE061_010721 [Apolygus lucorum]|uniref:Uncharacterized protein n=1 Tax=Apolygus lucorum TaxID=248454 RepID=A0A8S9XVQ3_APOLU|nr:hypothetical protein GE061_010721 [Apolygus lucorum]
MRRLQFGDVFHSENTVFHRRSKSEFCFRLLSILEFSCGYFFSHSRCLMTHNQSEKSLARLRRKRNIQTRI